MTYFSPAAIIAIPVSGRQEVDVRIMPDFVQNVELCVDFLRKTGLNLPFLCKMWSCVWIFRFIATHNSIFCSVSPSKASKDYMKLKL